jgi:UDP-N-acetylglucosamine transferase subunit ALG13
VIFVTVGTNEAPFDRLLNAVALIDTDEELLVQHGASRVRPTNANATCLDFMSFEELVEHVRRARIVVTHAGVGSVLVSLTHGKCPIVVPRLHEFGEAVDDHQLFFARRFAETGLVTLVEDPAALPGALDGTASAPAPSASVGSSSLTAELRSYLRDHLHPVPSLAGHA